MQISTKHLMVVPNPFAGPLDAGGRPCSAVQFDPEESLGAVRYIGAKPDAKPRPGRPGDDRRPGGAQYQRFDMRWEYNAGPHPIPDTMYHRERIRGGELLPADEPTARRAGVVFAKLEGNLAGAAHAALTAWSEQHPDDEPDLEAWSPWLRNLLQAAPKPPAAKPSPGPQDALREAEPGESLPEIPATAYPPGSTPLAPLSKREEGLIATAVLEPTDGSLALQSTSPTGGKKK